MRSDDLTEDNSAGSVLKISKFNRLCFEVFFFLIDTLVFFKTGARDPQRLGLDVAARRL